MILAIDASRANINQKTGVESYAFFVIQQLKTIIPSDISVILYSRESLKGKLADLPQNWKEKKLNWLPKVFWSQIRLCWEVNFEKPDVLFIPAHVSPFFYKGKVAVTIHDVAFKYFPKCYSLKERFYQKVTVSYMSKKAHLIFVPSTATKNDLIKFYKVEEGKVKVVYNGFNSSYHGQKIDESIKDSILNKYSIQKPYFLSIGRIEAKKNTIKIIQAFNEFQKNHENQEYQLVLIGKNGFGANQILGERKKSNYKSRIILPGFVEDNDLKIILQSSSVFLFPSLYEGFGIPILEAQSANVPVITSNISSMPEIAGEGSLLVNPHSINEITKALSKIIKDNEFKNYLINKGTENSAKFTWDKCALNIWNSIKESI